MVPTEQHTITYAIDGTNQWWQSPSIKNGRQFHWVTITLDLRQVGLQSQHDIDIQYLQNNLYLRTSKISIVKTIYD